MSIINSNTAGAGIFKQSGQQLGFGDNKQQEKDPYYQYPTRALAYTNEIGVALKPAIGAAPALGFWVPALAYFGMDIRDKYKKGHDGQENDLRPGARAGIFHAVASIAAPVAAIVLAQKGVMKAGGAEFANKVYEKLAKSGSTLAEKLKKWPLGETLVKAFGNPEKLVAEESRGIMKHINKVPVIGTDPEKEVKYLQTLGIKTKGAKNVAMALKAGAGFAALAAAAKPIDMLTENFFMKPVVDNALGLRDYNFNNVHEVRPSYQGRRNPYAEFLTIKNRASA